MSIIRFFCFEEYTRYDIVCAFFFLMRFELPRGFVFFFAAAAAAFSRFGPAIVGAGV